VNNREPSADPVLVEIVRNATIAVTEDMKTNLMRTAYNMIIYEALDFTVGLFTKDGDTVSIGLGLPMFIRGMAETLASTELSRAISFSPTTPTRPGVISTISHLRRRYSMRANWSASLAVWRIGRMSAERWVE